jgi:hypothetical protein
VAEGLQEPGDRRFYRVAAEFPCGHDSMSSKENEFFYVFSAIYALLVVFFNEETSWI